MPSSLMTPSLLLVELKKEFEDATKNMIIGDAERAPIIFNGYQPLKKANAPLTPTLPATTTNVPNYQVMNGEGVASDDNNFPFIIVRYLRSEDMESDNFEMATANFKFIFGVKTTSEQGYLDIMHLQEVVRLTLLQKGIIGGAAEIQRPLSMDVPEDQPYPYFYGECTASFIIPTILREVTFDGY